LGKTPGLVGDFGALSSSGVRIAAEDVGLVASKVKADLLFSNLDAA